ncbi:MAG: aminopeptidase P family protein [Lachnospiraceae bacterium]|nr:aminopeptidase P family protein [Lachnospiraceae bacterium]
MNSANIHLRLSSLRRVMKNNSVDIYICTVGDHHMSEYVCDHFKILEFFSGFSGSRATLVVNAEEAFLFTDGRYFLEAEKVLIGTGITLMREGVKDVPSLKDLLIDMLSSNDTLGLDSRFFSVKAVKDFINICAERGAHFLSSFSDPEKIISPRASLPESKLYILDEKYTGLAAVEKLDKIRCYMKDNECDTHIICNLTDIAYILNLRGSDIPYNPLFISYLLITLNDAVLFVSPKSITSEVNVYLGSLGVSIKNYEEFYIYIGNLSSKQILIDESRVNYALFEAIGPRNNVYSKINPSTLLKAIKNKTEQNNLRRANLIDAIAFIRFLYEFEKEFNSGKSFCENDCAELLRNKRQMSEQFICESFAPIIAAGSNAAIVHYEHKGNGKAVSDKDVFLLTDTGGHYLIGTTDVTRTIVIGEPDREQKEIYTRILKANIAISSCVFKKGTTGAGLDILARRELWKDGLDYRHGTGHGIGYLLSVHEGPFSLSYNTKIPSNMIPFEPGMLVSDEPGYYKDGEYGIRTENDLLVVPYKETAYGEFYKFEVLTLIPFDPKAMILSMLSNEEIEYIKDYHNRIFNEISNYLYDFETEWFIAKFISPLM